jgi:hypothetical protein
MKTNFSELGSFDLNERSICDLGQSACNFCFTNTSGTDLKKSFVSEKLAEKRRREEERTQTIRMFFGITSFFKEGSSC